MLQNQPYQLVQFIKNINIINGRAAIIKPYNLVNSSLIYPLDNTISNESQYFIKNVIEPGIIKPDYRVKSDGLIPFFNKLRDPKYNSLYQAFQSVILDSVSLIYSVENGSNKPLFNLEDINRVHSNISNIINLLYHIDVTGKIAAIIALRNLDVDIMYIFSTINDLDYSILDSSVNTQGKINLVPDSSFTDLKNYYSGDLNNIVIKDNIMIYNGDSNSYANITTRPLPVFPESTYRFRINSYSKASIYAVDETGNSIAYVSNSGSIVSDGHIIDSNQILDNVQQTDVFVIPKGVDYIKVSFILKQGITPGLDRISSPILVEGSNIGPYIQGAIS